MSVYTIDKCERFVSQRAGCGKAARPEFCEGCTTVRGAPTRPIKKILRCIVKSIDNPLYIYIQAYTGIVCIPKALEEMEYIEKIIVLVEGTSDKDILEFAMLHLYPHLSDLFYFMDFDDENGEKREGGTPFVNKNFETF